MDPRVRVGSDGRDHQLFLWGQAGRGDSRSTTDRGFGDGVTSNVTSFQTWPEFAEMFCGCLGLDDGQVTPEATLVGDLDMSWSPRHPILDDSF